MKTHCISKWIPIVFLGASLASSGFAADSGSGKIGVYESRAVALAWGRSTQHLTLAKQRYEAGKRAEAAGDKAELSRLKADGKGSQARLEKQVFGNERIPDIISRLEPSLPAIRQATGVESIVDKRDAPTGSTTVDVTSKLVAQFNPTERTLKMIEETLKHPPVSRIPKH